MNSQANHPPVAQVGQTAERLLDELERAIVGKRPQLALVLTAVFANGHVLLEDVPGVAKTATARALAQACGLDLRRVQFTPDLIPADVTGSSILASLDGGAASMVFQPGPLFANLVLGDEINRSPPKTQSALLEAMEERQVTVDGTSYRLPEPFLVIGTQNQIDQEGTYPLPEAQLDRFLFRLSLGYPAQADEAAMVRRRADRRSEQVVLDGIVSPEEVSALQQAVESVYVSDAVVDYMVAIVAATRASPATEAGASPRGSLALLRSSRSWAAIHGRDFVIPEDVKAVAPPALAHRIMLDIDHWVRGTRPEEVIVRVLDEVPAPAAEGARSS